MDKSKTCGVVGKSPTGKCKIYGYRPNVERNRLPGAPGGLPALVVEVGGQRHFTTHIKCSGPVEIFQDDNARPSIWIEADWSTVNIDPQT
ncbi:MAG: hypothetical protein E6R03_02565 [Hyphomicrobiaceae bacterium]|nr:MAG: hypothetical protein E6R03_02565 [Hyphomicrobiaceae bacterium]